MPTASTSAGTQKWLSVSTARRFHVFKKRSLSPTWAIASRLYNDGRRFQSGKDRLQKSGINLLPAPSEVVIFGR
jgi:hypothetical protein